MKKCYLGLVTIWLLSMVVASAWADPVGNMISYQKSTTLYYPQQCTMAFCLFNAEEGGSQVWCEEKSITLTSPTLTTNLGSSNPLDGVDFSQQLWVEVYKKKADNTYKVIGTRDKLPIKKQYVMGAVVVNGLTIKKVITTNTTAGTIVASTDLLSLERDGTNGGWRITNSGGTSNERVECSGINSAGATVNSQLTLPSPSTTQVYTDAQSIVYMTCILGDPYAAGRDTQITLHRYPGDYYWTGFLMADYTQ